ncbi:hypothetical protein ACFMJX_07310, partial [Acinetobacter baumannii]
MSKHTVLFELGCEELPPKSLKTLRDALQAETVKGLNEAGLDFASVEAYGRDCYRCYFCFNCYPFIS